MINKEIIGEIDDLTEVYTAIADAEEDVELLINSPGGSAFEAIQLVNLIEKCEHPVTAKVEVQAMSAAAVIALGCDHIKLDEKAIIMLHNCWTIGIGNANDFEQQAEAMHAVDNALQCIVTTHCSEENANYIINKMNDGELWLTGKQVAEMFDNVELVERPQKQGLLAAAGSLSDLVDKLNALEAELADFKAEAEKVETVEEIVEEETPAIVEEEIKAEAEEPQVIVEEEPKAYIVTDELKALLAVELE